MRNQKLAVWIFFQNINEVLHFYEKHPKLTESEKGSLFPPLTKYLENGAKHACRLPACLPACLPAFIDFLPQTI